ncbi:MAG: hypothetical protein ACTSQN_04455 [Candidatus Heimdallarchaeota archaeon]
MIKLNTKNGYFSLGKKRVLVFLFIFSLFMLTTPLKSSAIKDMTTSADYKVDYNTNYNSLSENPDDDSFFTTDADNYQVRKQIRVAIYDEANTTHPTYATSHGGNPNNNVSGMLAILSAADFISAEAVTAEQIHDHVLTTVNFDVLVLVDNHPREYIVNDILDFWLAGGGILAMDGSALFLNYFGVLPPEAATTDGYGVYWNYLYNEMNMENRHPMNQGYVIGADIALGLDYLNWDWAALQTSVIASDLTMVANSPTDANAVTALAFDPSDRGGKIATIAFDLKSDYLPGLNPMIIDACDWVAPRPKAKIAMDMSHSPRLGIDLWDDMSSYPDFYYGMRDFLVSLGFTFDKIFELPTGDALTASTLEQYDMLILITNDVDYTAEERTAIENWIDNGGSLLAMGDNHE